jgi:acetolactate synthase-1/2/3 large subunit
MLGMHGTYEANMAMQHCDVLIAIGALRRPRDRQPEALRLERPQDHPYRHRPVVDLQARQGGHPIVGNVKDVLQELLSQLDAAEPAERRGAGRLVEADQRMAQA